MFYICSVHGWNQYGNATWTGISGPVNNGGPDGSKVTHEWVGEHFQVGPWGEQYPDFAYIVEGDTPTFLYLIQNGLAKPEEPSWGSWGGRYLPINVSSRGVSNRGHFADAADTAIGIDGRKHCPNKATIWSWRNAFQNDFAARMQWTLISNLHAVNHHLIVSVNGDMGHGPLLIEVRAGSHVALDASSTYDSDGNDLTFTWYQYHEPSAKQTYHGTEVCDLAIPPGQGSSSHVEVGVPSAEKSCVDARSRKPLERGLALQLILEVTDDGTLPLTTYKRIILQPIRD